MVTGEHIGLYRMLSQLKVLELEVRTGTKFSNRINVFAQIKQEYGLKGSKAKVLEQFKGIVEKAKEQQAIRDAHLQN